MFDVPVMTLLPVVVMSPRWLMTPVMLTVGEVMLVV